MSCMNFSVLVYPLSFPSASCTSRTVLAPWRHSTARMAISESVVSGGGSGSLERAREAMWGEHYTNFFVCQRNNSYVRLIAVMNMPPVGVRHRPGHSCRLLGSQEDDGVDPHGPAEWNKRGDHRDHQQHDPA